MTRAVRQLLLLGALALLALPSSAHAADPVRDCTLDGVLDRKYSNTELRRALDNIPGDVDEYSDCRQIISSAIQSDSDKGDGRPTAGAPGGPPLTPEEQSQRAKDAEDLAAITGESGGEPRPPSVEVGGQTVKPGADGLFDLASASNDLPTPLLLALIALALLALAGGLVALRGRVPLLARLPGMSKIPTARVAFRRPRR